MTDYNSVVNKIYALAEQVSGRVCDAEWYVFGSILNKTVCASDIDVCIICRDEYDTDSVRNYANTLARDEPLHLSIFTREEEQELNFVTKQ